MRRTSTCTGLERLPWIMAAAAALAGCAKPPAQETAKPSVAADRLTVYTTFYPMTYFVERIAGDAVAVVNPCPADADPAYWMPDDATIAAYQQADLIIVNGATFEKWLDKVTLPQSRVVDTTAPMKDRLIVLEDTVTHSHGAAGEHTHEGIDGHTWLDPDCMRVQAGEIRRALLARRPALEETIEPRYASLLADIDALDARLRGLSSKLEREALLANHPAYNYLARAYGWSLSTVHIEPEAMPDDETLSLLRAVVEASRPRIMLFESEPAPAIARRLEDAFGLRCVVYSPCETIDEADAAAVRDFLSVMNENLTRMENALEP